MAAKKTKEAPTPPQQIVIAPKKELVLEGDPDQQLAFAAKASAALMRWVGQKKKKVMINGRQYLEYGDWQVLARFFGATAGVEWSRRLERDGKYVGYEARAVVHQHGEIISSAEAECLTTERNWKTRDEFAIRSMAQTRASAKALRNAFGWVAESAGYASTPAEEMTYDTTPIDGNADIIVSGTDTDEPVMPSEPAKQKQIIATLLKQHGVDFKDKKSAVTFVSDATQLELVESNYPAIIRALSK